MFPSSSHRPFGGHSFSFDLHTDRMADMRKRHDSMRTIIGAIFGIIMLVAVGSVIANIALAPQQKTGAHDQLLATCAELYPGEGTGLFWPSRAGGKHPPAMESSR